ncbi:UNVERIFIED_ORG: hypothetical protein ABIB13_002219 [Arthrobacter sp. UYEF2]
MTIATRPTPISAATHQERIDACILDLTAWIEATYGAPGAEGTDQELDALLKAHWRRS